MTVRTAFAVLQDGKTRRILQMIENSKGDIYFVPATNPNCGFSPKGARIKQHRFSVMKEMLINLCWKCSDR